MVTMIVIKSNDNDDVADDMRNDDIDDQGNVDVDFEL